MKKCPYCAEEILEKAIKCKHCGEMLNTNESGKSNYEYKTMSSIQEWDLDFYNTLLPKLGYEIISVNSHMNGTTNTVIHNFKGLFGKNKTKVTNDNFIETTYTLSLKRNINNVDEKILEISDEYLNLLDILTDTKPHHIIKEIFIIIGSFIPILIIFNFTWSYTLSDYLSSINTNLNYIGSMIVFFIIYIGFSYYRIRKIIKEKKIYKDNKYKFSKLDKIIEKR